MKGVLVQGLESLMLDDLHLKADTTILINALGSNGTLKELDLTYVRPLARLELSF